MYVSTVDTVHVLADGDGRTNVESYARRLPRDGQRHLLATVDSDYCNKSHDDHDV